MRRKVIAIERSQCDPENNMPIISLFAVQAYPLRPDDIVIAFEDDSEWEGKIIYQPNREEKFQWCIEIDYGSEKEVSEERMTGRNEGASAYMPFGEKRGELEVVKKMLADGMDVDIVSRYTRIRKDELIIIKNALQTNRDKQD